jgi:lysophospholipase L1-like esterase
LTQAIDAGPNVALVWIGSNDLWYLYEGGPEPMETAAEQDDLRVYEANIDKILQQLTGHGIRVFIALLDDQSKRPVVAHPNPTEPAFSNITPADLALMSAHVRAYNDVITDKAARYGAMTVDFYDTTIFTDAATLYTDGNHPNEAGYDRIAAIWFAALKPLL